MQKVGEGKNFTGQRIKELREAAGLSQRQLAEEIQRVGVDLDKNAITRIENGNRYVTDLDLRAIRQVLGVSYVELFGE